MCPSSAERVSELLLNWGHGDQDSREELIPLVYGELCGIARRYLCKGRPDHTLQSDALDHEAYLCLHQGKPPQWQNRAHFFGVAAQVMRHILVNHARSRLAAKLATMGPQQSRLIEMRFSGGPSIEEASVVLGISAATVKREWATARAWLHGEMKGKEARK